MNNLTSEKFKKLLKTESPKRILFNYMFKGLYLTKSQLGQVIDLKNKKG